jgi:glutamyl-tRNA synthetase
MLCFIPSSLILTIFKEWMSSTPKHLAIYQAFGWEPPAFAHVGLLLDKEGQKLSKRTGSIDITSWRDKGIFPETLTNFVALLGWSHEKKVDLMSMEDLIQIVCIFPHKAGPHTDFPTYRLA